MVEVIFRGDHGYSDDEIEIIGGMILKSTMKFYVNDYKKSLQEACAQGNIIAAFKANEEKNISRFVKLDSKDQYILAYGNEDMVMEPGIGIDFTDPKQRAPFDEAAKELEQQIESEKRLADFAKAYGKGHRKFEEREIKEYKKEYRKNLEQAFKLGNLTAEELEEEKANLKEFSKLGLWDQTMLAFNRKYGLALTEGESLIANM